MTFYDRKECSPTISRKIQRIFTRTVVDSLSKDAYRNGRKNRIFCSPKPESCFVWDCWKWPKSIICQIMAMFEQLNDQHLMSGLKIKFDPSLERSWCLVRILRGPWSKAVYKRTASFRGIYTKAEWKQSFSWHLPIRIDWSQK